MTVVIRELDRDDIPSVLEIAAELPHFFTPDAVDHISRDAVHLPGLVCAKPGAVPVGFAIWSASSFEAELLWLAVRPNAQRMGNGKALVQSLVHRLDQQQVLAVKTAGLHNMASGSELCGEAFRGTYAFYNALGFTQTGVLWDYWGPGQSAVVFTLRLRGSATKVRP